MPICNTILIRFYTAAHPVVRPYMMLVRFWAKVHDVAGGGKPASLLTNYALTMMMAFVIMNRIEILPPLAQLRRMPYQMVCVLSSITHETYLMLFLKVLISLRPHVFIYRG
jgi:DNA polymerase sigma